MDLSKSIVFCALLLISLNPVEAGWYNYIDATNDNTSAVNGASPWYDSSGSGDIWRIRTGYGYGNDENVFEGWTDEVKLVTTIQNLVPGEVYEVYAVFWDDTEPGTWGVQAGISEDSLKYYEKSNSQETGTTLPNLYEYRAFLGEMAADPSGEIKVYIDDGLTANPHQARTWYDGVEYRKAADASDFRLAVQPKDDNWVIDSLPDLNPGASTSLRVGYDQALSRNYFSYIKFELPEIPSLERPDITYRNLTSAKLYFKTDSMFNSNLNLGIYYTPETGWTEDLITWNTKPETDKFQLIHTYGPVEQIDTTNWLRSIDITEFVVNLISQADFEWTLVLKDINDSKDVSTYVKFFSSDAGDSSLPYLLMEWKTLSPEDLNSDGKINLKDLKILNEAWLKNTDISF